MNGRLLHFLTCIVLPLTIGFAIWTVSANDFSPAMKRRAQVGFPGYFIQAPIAVQFVGSAENLRAIFGEVPGAPAEASAHDRAVIVKGLHRDFWLVGGYTALMILLGLRSWQPGAPMRSWRYVLVTLPVLVGGADLLENIGTLAALKSYPDVSGNLLGWTKAASWTKWMLGFAQMGVLGYSLLDPNHRAALADFLREIAGLILLAAAFVGLWGAFFPSIIPTTFVLGLLAIVPIGLMLFNRDYWWQGRAAAPLPVQSS